MSVLQNSVLIFLLKDYLLNCSTSFVQVENEQHIFLHSRGSIEEIGCLAVIR